MHKIDRNELRKEYDELFPFRTAAVRELEIYIEEVLSPLSSRPKIKGRVKTFESYFKKCIRLFKDGELPPHKKISDIIGARVICPFLEDIGTVEKLLKEKFQVTEIERKGRGYTLREFGYESIHLLVVVPQHILDKQGLSRCETAEIQIRTILQDAWAEVEHELIYKAEFTPFDNPLKRKLAAVNATLSLADIVFQEIRSFQRQLNGQLGKRRDSFFQKIEASTDAVLFAESGFLVQDDRFSQESSAVLTSASIDELLLNALYAHNRNQFAEAIAIYTQILEMKPVETVSTLIYKHRGMAHFACSHYEKALADFSESLKLDPKSYKSAYYEGIIFSVLQRYPEAVDAFNRSLEINSYQPYCLFRRGQVYYHLEDYPQALADCDAALAIGHLEAAQKFKGLVLSKLKM